MLRCCWRCVRPSRAAKLLCLSHIPFTSSSAACYTMYDRFCAEGRGSDSTTTSGRRAEEERKKSRGMSRQGQGSPQTLPKGGAAAGRSRWLIAAVTCCGALAGGCMVEVVAAFASHSDMPLAPGHLTAQPLALVGAFSGALLAAMLAGRDQSQDPRRDRGVHLPLASADIAPSEAMMWQPVPHLVPVPQTLKTLKTLASTSAPPGRSPHDVSRSHQRVRLRVQRRNVRRFVRSRTTSPTAKSHRR
jgi:hypothetical protein